MLWECGTTDEYVKRLDTDFTYPWPDQQWELLDDLRHQQIHLKSDKGLCVDVPGADTENGKQVWTYECNVDGYEKTQRWEIHA